MKLNPIILVFGIVILAFGGLAFLFISSGQTTAANATLTATNTSTDQAYQPQLREFNTQLSGFAYNPESINVRLNDTVKINIKNNDNVTHGISLPVFGVNEFVSAGQTKTIQFKADKTGNPETFCSTDHGEKLLINVVP